MPSKQPKVRRQKLNERQRAFVQYFCGRKRETLGNATKSAQAAGYTGSYEVLASTGANLLKNPKVQQAIAELTAKVDKGATLNIARARQLLSMIAEDDPAITENELEFDMQGRAIPDPRKLMDPDVRAQIEAYESAQQIEVEVDAGGRTRRRRAPLRFQYPPGMDVYFRRRVKPSERRAAVMDWLRSKGLLVENVQVKTHGALSELLVRLKGKISPTAHDEVLRALASLGESAPAREG